MHIEVKPNLCEGHGLCEQAAPAVYQLDDEGLVHIHPVVVPETLLAAAEAGARVCPVAALVVHR